MTAIDFITETVQCFYCSKDGEILEIDTGEDNEITTCECCDEFVHYGCRREHEDLCYQHEDDLAYERSLFYGG